MYFSKSNITLSQIVDVVDRYCMDKGIDMPNSLRDDFIRELSSGVDERRLESMNEIRKIDSIVCKRIERILVSDQLLIERYGKFYYKVRENIRFRLVLIINQIKEKFICYLNTLDEGQSFSLADLSKWKLGNKRIGLQVYQFINLQKSRFDLDIEWNEDLIGIILGDEAEYWLNRNKLKKNKFELIDFKMELINFLQTLKEGESWYRQMFLKYQREDRQGNILYIGRRICNNLLNNNYIWDEKLIREVLGSDADYWLSRNPIIKYEQFKWDYVSGKDFLESFFESLKDRREFTISDICAFRDGVGRSGEGFYQHWMRRDEYKNMDNLSIIKDILGDDSYIYLSQYRFLGINEDHIIWDKDKISKVLIKFYNSMEEGLQWNTRMLRAFEIEGISIGERVYQAVLKTKKGWHEETLRYYLGDL